MGENALRAFQCNTFRHLSIRFVIYRMYRIQKKIYEACKGFSLIVILFCKEAFLSALIHSFTRQH